MTVSDRDILREIESIVQQDSAYDSRQQGKRFYDPQKLSDILESYVRSSNRTYSDIAKQFGMSSETLKKIVAGGSLSENMLFRIRNSIENARGRSRALSSRRKEIYPGDWRNTNTTEIQAAISEASERLIFLKRVIETSNALHSPESPIDKVQIAQLAALLEATLAAIKAPRIETHQAGGFFKWLSKIGKHAVEKGLEQKVSDAIEGAVDAGKDLLQQLADAAGSTDLGNTIT